MDNTKVISEESNQDSKDFLALSDFQLALIGGGCGETVDY